VEEVKERMDVYNAIDELIADGKAEGKAIGLNWGRSV